MWPLNQTRNVLPASFTKKVHADGGATAVIYILTHRGHWDQQGRRDGVQPAKRQKPAVPKKVSQHGPKKFRGRCYKCGKKGHRKNDCRVVDASHTTDEGGEAACAAEEQQDIPRDTWEDPRVRDGDQAWISRGINDDDPLQVDDRGSRTATYNSASSSNLSVQVELPVESDLAYPTGLNTGTPLEPLLVSRHG